MGREGDFLIYISREKEIKSIKQTKPEMELRNGYYSPLSRALNYSVAPLETAF